MWIANLFSNGIGMGGNYGGTNICSPSQNRGPCYPLAVEEWTLASGTETAQRIRGKQGLPWAGKGQKRRAQWVGCLRGEGVCFEWLKPNSRAGKDKGDEKQLEG